MNPGNLIRDLTKVENRSKSACRRVLEEYGVIPKHGEKACLECFNCGDKTIKTSCCSKLECIKELPM